MANKFQKSVLERKKIEDELRLKEHLAPAVQEQAALTESQPPAAPEQPIAEEIAVQPPAPAQTGELPPAPNQPKPPKPQEKGADIDLSAFLMPQNQRKAKNKCFYLDDDVINAIKTQSAKRKITESKLVNDILKSVLGL